MQWLKPTTAERGLARIKDENGFKGRRIHRFVFIRFVRVIRGRYSLRC